MSTTASAVESSSRASAPTDRFPPPRFPSGVGVGPAALVTVLVAGAALLVVTGIAVPAGILLLVVAVATHVTLRATLVAPVRRLRAEVGTGNPAASSIAEVDRIGTALGGGGGSARRVPVAAGVLVVASMVVGWTVSAGIAVLGAPGAPPAAQAQGQAAITAATDDLREALRDGLERVQTVAEPMTGAVLPDPGTAAGALAAAPFRSVSVVDGGGRTVATAGAAAGAPLEATGPEPVVAQVNDDGAEPVVVASVPMWDGVHTVVAEFDPRVLNDVLRHSGVHTRVVDSGLRTVLDTAGYIAFSPLRDSTAPVAREVVAGSPLTAVPDAGDGRTVAAGRLDEPGSPVDPGWVVVQDQDLDSAAFTGDPGRRAAVVVVALTAGLAAFALAWTAITAVGPLRRLARHVDSGSTRPFAPQRLDEIGAVAAILNRTESRR